MRLQHKARDIGLLTLFFILLHFFIFPSDAISLLDAVKNFQRLKVGFTPSSSETLRIMKKVQERLNLKQIVEFASEKLMVSSVNKGTWFLMIKNVEQRRREKWRNPPLALLASPSLASFLGPLGAQSLFFSCYFPFSLFFFLAFPFWAEAPEGLMSFTTTHTEEKFFVRTYIRP